MNLTTSLILGLTIFAFFDAISARVSVNFEAETSEVAIDRNAAAVESAAVVGKNLSAAVVDTVDTFRHPILREKDSFFTPPGLGNIPSKIKTHTFRYSSASSSSSTSSSKRRRRRLVARSPRTKRSSFSARSIFARSSYHSNAELAAAMKDLNRLYPNMTHVYSIGKSVRGATLYVIAIAAHDPARHVILRPEMKFVGNMHGNEVVGRELIIRYALYLLENYVTKPRVRSLLDRARIHLMPTMNPDGFDNAMLGRCNGVVGRANANNQDLNRNFPDYFKLNHSPNRQPETQSVMDWATEIQFVLSANMHGGAVVANYPFDNNKDATHAYSACPDDDIFRDLASTYAAHNPPMLRSREFKGGITNGAAWYPLPGGMQDWMYLRAGCMELTLEVSDCKYPLFSDVNDFWSENRDSMTEFLLRGFTGVKGVVKDGSGKPLAGVGVSVVGRPEVVMKTTSDGEFWRLLAPGNYRLQFAAECCLKAMLNVTVAPQSTGDNGLILIPETSSFEIALTSRVQVDEVVADGAGAATMVFRGKMQYFFVLIAVIFAGRLASV